MKSEKTDVMPVHADSEAIRPSKYRMWDNINMREAMHAVTGGMSVHRAAEIHGIPKSTLLDHVNGRTLPGAKSGPPTLLTAEEEKDLVVFLLKASSIGFGKTRKQVLAMVERILAARGEERTVTNGWWNKFRHRHREVVLRTPATVSVARMQGATLEALNAYFDELTFIFKKYGFDKSPASIFNMDESGFPLDPKPPKGVCARGAKNPFSVGSGQKTQITAVGCVSAAGQIMPPMVIWDRRNLKHELTKDEIPSTIYGLSDKGWMNADLFHKWFKRHFLRYAPSNRPLILLLDGHSSHYCTEAIRLASDNEIILFTLPPNTTHLTQPLHKGVFGPLKQMWRQVCHDYLVSHPGKVITRYTFSSLFSRAWMSSMTAANSIAGFQTTGIYPLDPTVVTSKLRGEGVASLYDRKDLQRYALYTPAKRVINSSYSSSDAESDDDEETSYSCSCKCHYSVHHTYKENTVPTIDDMCTPTCKHIPDTPLLELKRCLTSVEGFERKAELEKNKKSKYMYMYALHVDLHGHVHVYKFISVNVYSYFSLGRKGKKAGSHSRQTTGRHVTFGPLESTPVNGG